MTVHVNRDQDEGSLLQGLQYVHDTIKDFSKYFIQGQFFPQIDLDLVQNLQIYYMLDDDEMIRTYYSRGCGVKTELMDMKTLTWSRGSDFPFTRSS